MGIQKSETTGRKLWHLVKRPFQNHRAQSFIELALVLPVMIILLLGVVEVAFFLAKYLDMLDLTRESARFASLRDPFALSGAANCSITDPLNFYYHTSCTFSAPRNDASCVTANPAFCNGINSSSHLDMATDDVVISVYTVYESAINNVWPDPDGYWALSDHDSDTAHNGNWKRDCQGNTVRTSPYVNKDAILPLLESDAPARRGYVAVEVYYCHQQALGLPIISQFIPNPVRVHAYSIMLLPAAQPTAAPLP